MEERFAAIREQPHYLNARWSCQSCCCYDQILHKRTRYAGWSLRPPRLSHD
jgi:hypothetical protein